MTSAKSTILRFAALLAVVVASSAVEAGTDSFALRARRILPVSPDLPWVIENGVIVVRDGRIAAVGKDLEIPPDLPTIEFPDGTVVPGLVAAASDLVGQRRGGESVLSISGRVIFRSGGGAAEQGDESIAAGYRAADAFDRYADYARTLAAGVTTVHLSPGSHRLLSGQGAVAKLGGPPAARILRERADLSVNLGPDVYNPPPDVTFSFPASADVPIPLPRPQRPASRMGQFLALEEAIRDAMAGTRGERLSIHGPALAQAWKDKLPLRVRGDRAGDLLGTIKFLRTQQRAGYIVGGAEADRLADDLRTAGVPLVYQSRDQFRAPGSDIGRDPEGTRAALGAPACDFEALTGVKLALAPPVGQPVADLRLAAIRASGAGLGPRRTLEAVTRIPAEILGVADRVGSLAPGKDADLLVLTGDPLEVSSHVERVYVQGRCVFEPPTTPAQRRPLLQSGDRRPLVVKAGTVWAAPGKEIQDGQVLIEDGKIVAVGRSVPHPPFARVIDVRPNGFVTPGLIDSYGHLGLGGDRTAVGREVRLSKLVGAADVTDRRVAAAGVTTVLTAPYALLGMSSSAAAIKTAGSRRPQRVVRDPAAVLFDLSGADPSTVQETLGKTLEAGKKYLDTWNKYEKDLKEFLEARKKGTTGKPGTGEESREVTEKSSEPDPVSGTWEVRAWGGPLPGEVTVTIAVQLSGTAVEGRITQSNMGITGRLSGTFDGKHLSATIEASIPGEQVTAQLEADLAGEDRFKGTISVMGFLAQVEGRRVDKTPVELKVTSTRRLRGKGGQPLPPKVDESLEPLKDLLEKKIPAVVAVSTPAQIREVLALLVDKHELPVTLLNAEGASVHAARLAEKKVAVIVPPAVLRPRRNIDYLQADELARRSVPIAFQSDAEDGARDLPAVVLYAVERGLSAEGALEALTIGAARALKIDQRVGSLEPGKDADLVIFSGRPFEGGSRVLRVVVDGEEVRP